MLWAHRLRLRLTLACASGYLSYETFRSRIGCQQYRADAKLELKRIDQLHDLAEVVFDLRRRVGVGELGDVAEF
ncbi:hypothetical protein Pan189_32280 [Stratiformator vulcanicus]|uniref:Uncharacterized protein n=1 Tax=Stratiformator vulcanicus TaxID=2527980 RepID=A0A517R4M1_9PLAN|nr:hypothetical protein Pan189_32280 [Stratiformator vulcanicus]